MDILINIVVASVIISSLFVLIRVYFCCFADRDCTGKDCSHNLPEANEPVIEVQAPKKAATKKAKLVAKEPAKKRPGRKKKSDSGDTK